MANLTLIDKFYKKFCENPGKMLIHTGVIGWIMSSAAQIFAIAINDKIPKEQKMFMVPQEFADACVNILSFYAVTRTFTSFADKMVKCGKLIQKPTKKWLIKNGYENLLGKTKFDISKIKLPAAQRRSHELFKDGVDLTAATVGGIISCNIITPVIRNLYASKRQKQGIAYLNKKYPKKSQISDKQYHNVSMADFQTRAYSLSSGLKI